MTNFDDKLTKLDPEFTEFFDRFEFEEVIGDVDLDNKTKYMAILATLLGCQGIDEYKVILKLALDNGVTAVEAKEILYQATAYLGIGRVYPFLEATNNVMEEKNIKLPLKAGGNTTAENRREMGTKKQIELFGDNMKDFWKQGKINYYLASNCFGDYYTRDGLSNSQREMVTFCYIAAQGGCEPQLKAHTAANLACGNDREFLSKIVLLMVPFIGYPRSLNANAVVNQVAEGK